MTTKSKFNRFLMRSISCGVTNQLGNKILYRIKLKTDLAALFLDSISDEDLRESCKCTRCLDNLRQWGNTAYFDESRGTYASVFFDVVGEYAEQMVPIDPAFEPFAKKLHELLNQDPEIVAIMDAQTQGKPSLGNVGYEHFHIKQEPGVEDSVRCPDMPRVLKVQSRWFGKWGNNSKLIREASTVVIEVVNKLSEHFDTPPVAAHLLRLFNGFEAAWHNQHLVRTKAQRDGNESMMLPVMFAMHYAYTENQSPYILSILDSLYSDPEGKYREGLVERTVKRIISDLEIRETKYKAEFTAHYQSIFDGWVEWLYRARTRAINPQDVAMVVKIIADLDSLALDHLPLIREVFDSIDVNEVETLPETINRPAVTWLLDGGYAYETRGLGGPQRFVLSTTGVLAKHLLASKK